MRWGEATLCFHFHFPARTGHAKIPQGRMLRVVFLLETESRSAVGLVRPSREFCSLVFGTRGEVCAWFWRSISNPAHRPSLLRPTAGPAGAPSPIPSHTYTHTHAHTHTRACAEPGAPDPAQDPALARSSRSEHVKESH